MSPFCGSSTKPCGPYFAPQSATKRLVASASPSGHGRHSEEPRVVVMKATQTTKNSTGHSRRDLLVYLLVTCFGETKSHLGPAQGIMQRVLGNPSSTIPWCCLTPNQEESTFISAVSSGIVRQLDATCNTGFLSPCGIIAWRHESAGSCSADLPSGMRGPRQAETAFLLLKWGPGCAGSVRADFQSLPCMLSLECFPEPPEAASGHRGRLRAQSLSMRAADWGDTPAL